MDRNRLIRVWEALGPERSENEGQSSQGAYPVDEGISHSLPLAPQMAFSFSLQRLWNFPEFTGCTGRLLIGMGPPGQGGMGGGGISKAEAWYQVNNEASYLLWQQWPHNSKEKPESQKTPWALGLNSKGLNSSVALTLSALQPRANHFSEHSGSQWFCLCLVGLGQGVLENSFLEYYLIWEHLPRCRRKESV